MSELTKEDYMKLVNTKIRLTSFLEQIDEQIENYENSEDSRNAENDSENFNNTDDNSENSDSENENSAQKISSENKSDELENIDMEKIKNESNQLYNEVDKIEKNIENEKNSFETKNENNSFETKNAEKSELANNSETFEKKEDSGIDANSEIEQERKIPAEMQESLEKIQENCLIISEKNHKVILPFTHRDLEELYKNNEKYDSWQDVIRANYVVKLSEYKHPVTSRFRETYKLMREREKVGVFASLNFALSLAWNSYLNPAVITACKNKEELDIYLDCLYNNELDDFHIFNVKYEYTPLAMF